MKLTDRASQRLEDYLGVVRETARREQLDDVEIEAEILGRLADEFAELPDRAITIKELDVVLERLGEPELWATGEAAPSRSADRIVWLAVASGVIGGILILAGHFPVGFFLLLLGALGSHVLLRLRSDDDAQGGRALVWYRNLAAVAALACLLVGPGVMVWGAAQAGGYLEARWGDPTWSDAQPRPVGYWRRVAGAGLAISGGWWMLLGMTTVIARRWGPDRTDPNPSRLSMAGRALVALGIVGGVAGAGLLFL